MMAAVRKYPNVLNSQIKRFQVSLGLIGRGTVHCSLQHIQNLVNIDVVAVNNFDGVGNFYRIPYSQRRPSAIRGAYRLPPSKPLL